MTRILIAILLLGTLASCESYTNKISPCFGRNGHVMATNAAYIPALRFVSPAKQKAGTGNCTFRPIGVSA
ncbi:hypothetical protein [Pseudorhodobacter sp.]|uniref:hypothetical protein n=1 Tax=Pseudorhodobacter sp. TaxID=1934400 RepID=UPI002648BAF8|nr:hypothetical protein [Pseudorhodobacter sp.]MDN5788684.1 hypothetical protein [Pseudorhodobacter sp.]